MIKKQALICNTLIFILEIIGFISYINRNRTMSMEYYTMDSNLLALITSLLYLMFYKKDKQLVRDLRFITSSCLTITFLVVIFILAPMLNFNYKLLMLDQEFIMFHTLCPIISILSYIFFEERSDKNYIGFLFTIFYAFVLIILNIVNIVNGPYPFLRVKEQTIIMSLIWGIIIIGGSYFIGLSLNFMNKKIKGA